MRKKRTNGERKQIYPTKHPSILICRRLKAGIKETPFFRRAYHERIKKMFYYCYHILFNRSNKRT